jgi:hypothetical protein
MEDAILYNAQDELRCARNQVSDAEYTIWKLEEKLEKERHGNAREDDTANSLEEVGNDFVHRPSSV